MGNDCLVSVDGTDCPIQRRWCHLNGKKQWDKRFYTHKFHAHGLRYEVALSLLTSSIVWISGPYMPGVYNDVMIFRDGLIHQLEEGERVEADDGYIGECPRFCKCPGGFHGRLDQERMRGRVRMRHETVNKRLKQFACLTKKFRHSAEKHSACFRGAAILTQLAIEGGEELFDVREYDDALSDLQVEQLYGL